MLAANALNSSLDNLLFLEDVRPWVVRLIQPGESYGLDDCLINDSKEALIEFYDATYAGDEGFGPLGQFVSRYHLTTLQAHQRGVGLALDWSHQVWHLSAETSDKVLDWILA
jgi:hypothetical protein